LKPFLLRRRNEKEMQNIFINIYIEDEESTHINMERKANKKMREIAFLKQKDTLTDSEKEKISRELFWKNILNPPSPEPPNETENDTKKRLKKEKERLKKKEEKERKRREKEKREEEQQRKKKEEKERARREKEKRQEEQQRKKKEEKERARREEEHRWNREDKREDPIETEYKRVLKDCDGNKEKTFRKCSLKYHPDRNKGENATQNQQRLLEIHQKYSMK
jgi:hypothetical protein